VNSTTVNAIAVYNASNGAKFQLALQASPALLANIASFRYDVDALFKTRYATSTDRANAFITTIVYQAYDHDWQTNGTELTLVNGTKVNLPGTAIQW